MMSRRLPSDLLNVIEQLQTLLDEEGFDFVSDEIDQILDRPSGEREQLLALRDILRKLGTAKVILGSTGDEIDRVEQTIELHLHSRFDA